MANDDLIKIIPKSKPKISKGVNVVFNISLALLLIVVILFFFLQSQNSSLNGKKQELEKRLSGIRGQTDVEKRILSVSAKIKDFSNILENHKLSSKIIDFLKKSCHQKVKFTSLIISGSENQINVSGETENFKILGEQILKLRTVSEISNLRASNIFLNINGKVEFSLIFNFSKDFFK